ncbi:MAG: DNA mismatch repair protein MutS [bacterium]
MSSKQTPLEQQYFQIKAQHPDKILFFRMGDFYEMFGRDAEIAAPILGIALTSRAHGKSTRMPLAGVPYHAAEKYLAQLVRAGHKVAVCEQTEDPKQAKGLVRREVIEIITPGTVTVDGALTETQDQMIAALSLRDNEAGLAALDLSTGRVLFYQAELSQVLERLEVLEPCELLLADDLDDEIAGRLGNLKAALTNLEAWRFQPADAAERVRKYYEVQSLEAFGLGETELATGALGALLGYLEEVKFGIPRHLAAPRLLAEAGHMYLDPATLHNLEVLQPSATTVKEHSLLGLLDHCHTAGGKRLLARWLQAPLRQLEAIVARHDAVAQLLASQPLRDEFAAKLSELADLERLAGKLGYRKAGPRDLVHLKDSLLRLPALRKKLSQLTANLLLEIGAELPELSDIAERIETALRDEVPYMTGNGSLIREGFSEDLDRLKASIKEAVDYIAGLQEHLRAETEIPSLKVGYNRVFGYYIEVTRAHQDKVPDYFIRKQTLVNAERYITTEMKEREELIVAAEEKINRLEEDIFLALRAEVATAVDRIALAGRLISRLDVLLSFAEASHQSHYTRPMLDESQTLDIREGRHPIIERVLARGEFVANDTLLTSDDEQLQLLTGPNMAGKSTYLRQVGLLVIMAQAGCFVPAREARIGLVDRVFTRVGASDRLALGESTFLVEMNETSRILANATPQSLILLDEVGRGTSTYDGLAIAWALCETLHSDQNLRARTIFATHFHELTRLAELFPRIRNYQVRVRRWQDQIVFLRQVVPGGCDDSFGIEVARLAGVPQSLTDRARQILHQLERGQFDPVRGSRKLKAADPNQLGLFGRQVSKVAKKLTDLELDHLTPLDALNLLAELKADAEEENGATD